MAVRIWQMDFLMTMGMQQMRIRPMAIGARCSGDNLGTEAIHSCQWKTKKMQRTGIRPMAIGTQQTDSSLRAEANHYIRGAR